MQSRAHAQRKADRWTMQLCDKEMVPESSSTLLGSQSPLPPTFPEGT